MSVMGACTDIVFHLNITADEYVRVYSGTAKYVITKSIDGKSIKFPVNILQPYLTHDGVSGMFSLKYDKNNKFISIQKID